MDVFYQNLFHYEMLVTYLKNIIIINYKTAYIFLKYNPCICEETGTGGPFVRIPYLNKRNAIFTAQASCENAVLVLPAIQWKVLRGTSVIYP